MFYLIPNEYLQICFQRVLFPSDIILTLEPSYSMKYTTLNYSEPSKSSPGGAQQRRGLCARMQPSNNPLLEVRTFRDIYYYRNFGMSSLIVWGLKSNVVINEMKIQSTQIVSMLYFIQVLSLSLSPNPQKPFNILLQCT